MPCMPRQEKQDRIVIVKCRYCLRTFPVHYVWWEDVLSYKLLEGRFVKKLSDDYFKDNFLTYSDVKLIDKYAFDADEVEDGEHEALTIIKRLPAIMKYKRAL